MYIQVFSGIVNNADKCNLPAHKQTNNKVCYARNDAQAYLCTDTNAYIT